MGRKSHLAVNQDPRNPRVYQSKIAEIYGCLYPPVIWYLIGVCTKSRHWKTEPFWKDFQTSLWNSAWKVQQKIQILGFLAPRKCSRTIPLPPNIQTYPSLYNPIGDHHVSITFPRCSQHKFLDVWTPSWPLSDSELIRQPHQAPSKVHFQAKIHLRSLHSVGKLCASVTSKQRTSVVWSSIP